MDVSVIIVNWNTRDILRNCLSSVFRETQGIEYEVIVTDNGSTDGSVEMVKAEFPQVILTANAENRGFAAANNQALRISTGRYALLLNSDTVILDGAITKTVAFADAHPQAAVVGCRVLNPDGMLQPTCFMFPSLTNMILSSTYLYKVLPHSRLFGRERMTWWDRDSVRQVDVVTGCFMFVRREAIGQIGLMDERFFVYGEETDWCYRFKQAGWEILFTPDPKIVHLGGSSSRQIRSKMRLQLAGSILIFFRKHKGFVAYVFACLFTALFFIIRVPYWLAAAVVSKGQRLSSLSTAYMYIAGFFLSLTGWKRLCVKRRSGLL